MQNLEEYLRISGKLPGWIRGEEAVGLAMTSLSLPAVLVQIGRFFGSAAILIAGARRLRGTGKLHCVDPFDCSGDDFSVPHYRRLLTGAGGGPLRGHFERNIRCAGLEDWIEVHPGSCRRSRSRMDSVDRHAHAGRRSITSRRTRSLRKLEAFSQAWRHHRRS